MSLLASHMFLPSLNFPLEIVYPRRAFVFPASFSIDTRFVSRGIRLTRLGHATSVHDHTKERDLGLRSFHEYRQNNRGKSIASACMEHRDGSECVSQILFILCFQVADTGRPRGGLLRWTVRALAPYHNEGSPRPLRTKCHESDHLGQQLWLSTSHASSTQPTAC